MFGLVMADVKALTEQEQQRYYGVYCGICRQIRERSSNLARLGLSYDMAFLALLHMSLYEPEEEGGERACMLHPVKPRSWISNPYVEYCADMNVVLSYFKGLDDRQDGKRLAGKAAQVLFGDGVDAIMERYPRQYEAIRSSILELNWAEKENVDNPDLPAGCFGKLMAELFVYEEDRWSDTLRQMGDALGRFIYLADAAIDYRSDLRKKNYNPFIAMGTGEDRQRWEEYLVLSMSRCTGYYERLPLVQDKGILDNILYSGVWLSLRRQQQGGKQNGRSV